MPCNIKLAKGESLGHNFSVVKRIGRGSFGSVYRATGFTGSDREVAVKVARVTKHGEGTLQFEARVLERLSGAQKVATLFGYYCHGDLDVLITNLLGPSLDMLFRSNHFHFEMHTILAIGSQVTDALQQVHCKDLLHRDIKPANICIGLDDKATSVILVDFGLAKTFFNSETKKHAPLKTDRGFVGTPDYASVNAHLGLSLSRRDDLESLAYTLLYFLRGSLPWHKERQKDPAKNAEEMQEEKRQQHERMAEMKAMATVSRMFRDFGASWSPLFEYCKMLSYDTRPDYRYLRRMLRNMAWHNGMCLQLDFEHVNLEAWKDDESAGEMSPAAAIELESGAGLESLPKAVDPVAASPLEPALPLERAAPSLTRISL